jgi:predicted dehydrogenase
LSKVYKIGVASMVHDHVWGDLKHWAKLPNVELVAAADINAPLRERAQNEYGVARTYSSLLEMLDNEDLDIVHAAAENNRRG